MHKICIKISLKFSVLICTDQNASQHNNNNNINLIIEAETERTIKCGSIKSSRVLAAMGNYNDVDAVVTSFFSGKSVEVEVASRRIMIVLKDDAYKTNKAKCIKEKYNLPPFDINANLNAAKRINQPQKIHVVVAVAVADIAIVSLVVVVVVF